MRAMSPFVVLLSISWSMVAHAAVQGNGGCKLQIGCCASIADLEAVQRAGFDYCELRVSEVAGLGEEEFRNLAVRLKELRLPTPAANTLLPGAVKVTGPLADGAQQLAYLRKALDRVASLGVKVVVFGSSGARNVPDGFSRERAMRQLVEFCRLLGAEAEARDLTVAIEPLRPQESNIVNTVPEGVALVEAAGHPRVQLLVDFYHMAIQKEDFSVIDKAAPHIRHAHIANPNGRVYPKAGDGSDYAGFLAALRRIGYCGRLSVEANTTNMQLDAPAALSLLKF
jgi:D-psicose/D-tagatose/L-ribulose 3-epimerase